MTDNLGNLFTAIAANPDRSPNVEICSDYIMGRNGENENCPFVLSGE